MRRMVIVDIEATCDVDRGSLQETIEIGAARIDLDDPTYLEAFDRLIRPQVSEVTRYCTSLTTITPEMVEQEPVFQDAFPEFVEWMAGCDRFSSWGMLDWSVMLDDCNRYGVDWPFKHHINLANQFTRKYGRRLPHRKAMQVIDLEPVGQHHRGVDDALNIAAIARVLYANEKQS